MQLPECCLTQKMALHEKKKKRKKIIWETQLYARLKHKIIGSNLLFSAKLSSNQQIFAIPFPT